MKYSIVLTVLQLACGVVQCLQDCSVLAGAAGATRQEGLLEDADHTIGLVCLRLERIGMGHAGAGRLGLHFGRVGLLDSSRLFDRFSL